MKHLQTLFFLLAFTVLPFLTQAQSPKSQRLVLLEQFTSSTCGPCASANPTIVQRLQQNPDKFTAIFYHVGWPSPGNDPMYLHNTADNNARVSYYSVNSVPRSVIDGNYFVGNPSGWSMTTINNRYAVPSPFEIDLQHTLNAAQDSIFLNMLIKVTADVSASQLVAHNAVIEKLIHFTTAPGTNGEKDFHNVLKKLLPSAGGTGLPSNLSAGDYILIQTAWKLANVYNNSELAAIGFVQSNATKEVYQTANSSTDPVSPLYANDAEVLSIEDVAPQNCMGYILPAVKVRNNGSNAMTSLNIKYRVNDGDIQEYTWTGNTSLLGKATITLPEYAFQVEANNTLKVYIDKINSVNDEYPKNDTLSFAIKSAKVATPELSLWIKTDNKPQETTWEILDSDGNQVLAGGPYSTAATLVKENFTLDGGKCYQFIIHDAGKDGLCCANGLGFFTLFYGNNQVIAEGTTFTHQVLAQFATESGVGVPAPEALRAALRISPNPAGARPVLHFTQPVSGASYMNIYSLAGQKILTLQLPVMEAGSHEMEAEFSAIPLGMYIAELYTPDGSVIRTKFTRK